MENTLEDHKFPDLSFEQFDVFFFFGGGAKTDFYNRLKDDLRGIVRKCWIYVFLLEEMW